MNEIEYRYKNKHKDAVEIELCFINIKELKYVYIEDGNKLAQAMVGYH